jgi:hypothetical protein
MSGLTFGTANQAPILLGTSGLKSKFVQTLGDAPFGGTGFRHLSSFRYHTRPRFFYEMKKMSASIQHAVLMSPRSNFLVFPGFELTFVWLVPTEVYRGWSDFGGKPR